jgi:hypothetical protein
MIKPIIEEFAVTALKEDTEKQNIKIEEQNEKDYHMSLSKVFPLYGNTQ